MLGKVKLYCPICGKEIIWNKDRLYYYRSFGNVCSKECLDEAEIKYCKAILGKDSL